MEYNMICGKRQLEFIKQFDYIREAGTDGEEKAALEIQRELKSFGVDSRLEEFEIDTWRILKAEFTVTEPFEKTYTVAGYGRCGSTAFLRYGGLYVSFSAPLIRYDFAGKRR